MCGLLGLHYFSSSLRRIGIVEIRASTHIVHWVLIPAIPPILPMGLLVVIPVMLAYWLSYLFSWDSPFHLLHIYLLFFSLACWPLFLPCRPIELVTSFLRLPQPTYFIFTSYSSHGPAGHVIPTMLAHWVYYLAFIFLISFSGFYYWGFHKKMGVNIIFIKDSSIKIYFVTERFRRSIRVLVESGVQVQS